MYGICVCVYVCVGRGETIVRRAELIAVSGTSTPEVQIFFDVLALVADALITLYALLPLLENDDDLSDVSSFIISSFNLTSPPRCDENDTKLPIWVTLKFLRTMFAPRRTRISSRWDVRLFQFELKISRKFRNLCTTFFFLFSLFLKNLFLDAVAHESIRTPAKNFLWLYWRVLCYIPIFIFQSFIDWLRDRDYNQ